MLTPHGELPGFTLVSRCCAGNAVTLPFVVYFS